MADGSTKAIEDIEIGDKVTASDVETDDTQARTVTRTIEGDGTKHLVTLTIDTDGRAGDETSTITATENHPFWLPDLARWVDAGDLKRGQWLSTGSGSWVQITAVKARKAQATVHNLTVAGLHTFYVLAGATSVLAHNCDEAGLAAAERAGNHFAYPGGATGALRSDELGWFADPLSSGGRNIHPGIAGNPAPGTKAGYAHHLEAQAAALMRQNPGMRNSTLYINFRDPNAAREVCWACNGTLEDMLPTGASLTVVFRQLDGSIFRSRPYIGNAN
ncbi:polymorphic toxin-type HINT domain-containing protein [Streptomyces akebiae]|uniref:Intein C-terminal splicing domain-containing protein n=1 Tax=Streptomyces akebiae TaxID=2865673 RepID=A0ABX8Y0H0_9ACTN|nr:polymorphic toxin-type HINT domain-containing protein [Streptomyces akebiae]QYX81017.1 hypothetical protein K1J60_34750 [Streptomyces akebiae]